jgi:hypothetical protein
MGDTKAIVRATGGKGFTNCFASFGFTVDGQFLGYYVTG